MDDLDRFITCVKTCHNYIRMKMVNNFMNFLYNNWSILQTPEEIHVGRFFEYDKDALQFFSEKLPFLLKKNTSVLEVGAGPGFFTEKLLSINPEMKLTCLEPDENFSLVLQKKFKKITIIKDIIENLHNYEIKYDVVLSHIVVHNVVDPIRALREMKMRTKLGGFLVCIEPLPSGRQYFPDKQVQEAVDLLEQVKRYRTEERNKKMQYKQNQNPWYYNYPQLFHNAGISFKHAYGWTSVFTLSDERYDYKERKKWIKLRERLYLSNKEKITNILTKNGKPEKEIAHAFEILFGYFRRIDLMNQNELSQIHEQEITHRIVCTGQNTQKHLR